MKYRWAFEFHRLVTSQTTSATGRSGPLRHSVQTLPTNPLMARHPVRVGICLQTLHTFQRHCVLIFLVTIGFCNHVCLGTLHNFRISDRYAGRFQRDGLRKLTACRSGVLDAMSLLVQPCGWNIKLTSDQGAKCFPSGLSKMCCNTPIHKRCEL